MCVCECVCVSALHMLGVFSLLAMSLVIPQPSALKQGHTLAHTSLELSAMMKPRLALHLRCFPFYIPY